MPKPCLGAPSHAISEVRVRPVPNGGDGLIAFVSCRYGGVLLNDIAIRRDPSGSLFLTYPRKLGSSGRAHPLHHPIDARPPGSSRRPFSVSSDRS